MKMYEHEMIVSPAVQGQTERPHDEWKLPGEQAETSAALCSENSYTGHSSKERAEILTLFHTTY